MSDRDSAAPSSGGLLHSLRALVSTLIEAVYTRLEIVSTEIAEERERFKAILIAWMLAAVFFALALVLLTIFVLVLFWGQNLLLVTGILTVLYLGAGIWAAAVARARSRHKSRLFAATLAELKKDREQLSP